MRRAGFLAQRRSIFDANRRFLDQGRNLAGRLARTLGQFANFVGHDGESHAVFAGASRFDGRIQSQQIRLAGDFGNHLDDFADLIRRLLDQLHRLDGLADSRPALLGQLAGAGGRLVGFGCAVLHAIDAANQFLDRGAHFFGRSALGLRPFGQRLRAFGDHSRTLAELRRSLDDLTDNVTQLTDHIGHAAGELTNGIVAADGDLLGQVACSGGVHDGQQLGHFLLQGFLLYPFTFAHFDRFLPSFHLRSDVARVLDDLVGLSAQIENRVVGRLNPDSPFVLCRIV